MLLLVGKACLQAGVHGRIQVRLQRHNLVVEPRGVLGTLEVGVVDVLQDRFAALEHIVVRHVVEEEQQLFGAGLHIGVHFGQFGGVLVAVIAARGRAVNANAVEGGAVVAAPAAVLITVNVGAVVVVGVDHPAHAQGGVVFFIGGPGLHQNAVQRLFHRLIVAEGQPQPLAGNHGGVQRGVIAQAAESVEVRSGQVVAGPVFIVAGVGHGHHSVARALDQRTHMGVAVRAGVHVEVQNLAEPGHQVADVALLARVLLRNLELHGNVGVLQAANQRGDRFAHLEVHGAVLDLQRDVVAEGSVQRHKIVVACAGAVNLGIAPILLAVVDETTPDNVTAAGGHSIGQHVCAVGLVATVGEGAGAALGVGLYQETTQAGQVCPDLLGLIRPPLGHSGVAGVGGVHAAQLHRGGKVDAQIQLDAVGGEDFQILLQGAEVAVGDEPAGGVLDVDVIDCDAVDAHGREHTGVSRQTRYID